jgi:hypothetical protein
MARIIKVQIDLAKISKEKIRINGQYKNYDIVLIETPNGQYGQWMVTENQSKEERDSGTKAKILGNGKNVNWGESGSSGSKPAGNTNVSYDDLPI